MTEGEPETVVSASLQKIKSIKNQIKLLFFFFNFIKSETSDSFDSHFNGHFAYLKTLDFYFKHYVCLLTEEMRHEVMSWLGLRLPRTRATRHSRTPPMNKLTRFYNDNTIVMMII